MSSPGKPTAEMLRQIHLFETFDEGQITMIRQTMRVRELDDGERLFDFGQPPLHFYFVRRGQIKLFRNSATGSEKVIEIVRSGETFAEAAMFMRRAQGYPVSAEALTPSQVWAFDSHTMVDLLRESMDTCFRIMASLSIRLRQHVDEIDRLTLHNATFRLVSFLLDQIPDDGAPRAELGLSIPKNVLASRLGIQPETLSRILARLSRDGLLAVNGSEIIIEDLQGLRNIADPDLRFMEQANAD